MKKFIVLSLLCIVFSSTAHSTYAAIFGVSEVSDTREKEIKVTLSLDAKEERLNAYSGLVEYDRKKLYLKHVDTSNSIVTGWVTYPELDNSPDGDSGILFEGVTVGGFDGVVVPDSTKKDVGKLFTLVFSVREGGDATVSFSQLTTFIDDGNATEENYKDAVLTVKAPVDFVKNSYLLGDYDVTRKENETSNDLYVTKATTSELYDGRSFIIFENLNKQKSVVSFEVSESPTSDPKKVPDFSWTKAKSPYLLTESGLTRYVHVRVSYTDGTYTYKTLETVEKVHKEDSLSYILMLITLIIISIFYAATLLIKKE